MQVHLSRNEIEELAGERFAGETGLWSAVLLNLLQSLSNPKDPDHDQALRIIRDQQYPLPLIAAVLGIDSGELKERILRALKRKDREL